MKSITIHAQVEREYTGPVWPRPCPFCPAEKPEDFTIEGCGGTYRVVCRYCAGRGPFGWTPEGAVNAFNGEKRKELGIDLVRPTIEVKRFIHPGTIEGTEFISGAVIAGNKKGCTEAYFDDVTEEATGITVEIFKKAKRLVFSFGYYASVPPLEVSRAFIYCYYRFLPDKGPPHRWSTKNNLFELYIPNCTTEESPLKIENGVFELSDLGIDPSESYGTYQFLLVREKPRKGAANLIGDLVIYDLYCRAEGKKNDE